MKARLSGAAYDVAAYDSRVKRAVAECVRKQVETGIDIVSDGEQSKSGFFSYVRERLEGFEARPHQTRQLFAAEVANNCLRSEEHTSELQSQSNLVCRLLLEKKKNNRPPYQTTLR